MSSQDVLSNTVTEVLKFSNDYDEQHHIQSHTDEWLPENDASTESDSSDSDDEQNDEMIGTLNDYRKGYERVKTELFGYKKGYERLKKKLKIAEEQIASLDGHHDGILMLK